MLPWIISSGLAWYTMCPECLLLKRNKFKLYLYNSHLKKALYIFLFETYYTMCKSNNNIIIWYLLWLTHMLKSNHPYGDNL